MINRRFALIGLSALLILTEGCAALQNYTQATEQARQAIALGDYEAALASFPATATRGGNEVLMRMERGTLLQAVGRYRESSSEFETAARKIEAYENRAVISASKGAAQVASLVVNEQAKPYEGEDYEKVLVHTLNALNYLMLGDIEGARVEIRNSYRRQQELYDKHSQELEKSAADSRGKEGMDAFRKADSQGYDLLVQHAGGVRSIYQSAFAYYVSALVYELNREQDEAYIDLKKGIDAAPDCRAIQRDLIRLSRELHYPNDLARWEQTFGKVDPPMREGIDIFLVFELGQAPYKEAITFPVPTGSGLVSVAFPTFRFVPTATTAAVLGANGRTESTSIVADIDAIAARNLLDMFPILFIKQIARTAIKGYATHELNKKYGVAGAIAGSIAAIITEQADLRTWSTLPKQIQVARLFVPKTQQELSITSLPGGSSGSVSIPAGTRHMIIVARASEGALNIESKAY